MIFLAKICGPHGLNGSVKTSTTPSKNWTKYELFDSEKNILEIEVIGKNYIKLKDVNNIQEAAKLKNKNIYTLRSCFEDIKDPDCFYNVDLIGMSIESDSGSEIGIIADVLDFGAGILLKTSDQKWVPFNKNFISNVTNKVTVFDEVVELI
jgi:16S rRNA processing protein RimM